MLCKLTRGGKLYSYRHKVNMFFSFVAVCADNGKGNEKDLIPTSLETGVIIPEYIIEYFTKTWYNICNVFVG